MKLVKEYITKILYKENVPTHNGQARLHWQWMRWMLMPDGAGRVREEELLT